MPAILCLLVFGFFIAQSWQLMDEGMLARFAMISKYEDATPNVEPVQAQHSMLYRLLDSSDLRINNDTQMSDLLNIQEWLGNQVSKVGVSSTDADSEELLAFARTGGGLACGAMAQLFQDLLGVQGIQTRRVQLYRSNFEPTDTHVIVEAQLVNGRWVAFDPTFNLTFHDKEGQALGVAEIRQYIAGLDRDAIITRYHGDRLYPADIQRYDIDWRVLFANAYVASACPDCTLLERLPPLRFWHGPVRYAFGEDIGLLAKQHNRHYFTVVVVYPILAFGVLVAALWSVYRCRTS